MIFHYANNSIRTCVLYISKWIHWVCKRPTPPKNKRIVAKKFTIQVEYHKQRQRHINLIWLQNVPRMNTASFNNGLTISNLWKCHNFVPNNINVQSCEFDIYVQSCEFDISFTMNNFGNPRMLCATHNFTSALNFNFSATSNHMPRDAGGSLVFTLLRS